MMNKQARLEARVTPEVHALLKRAAEIQGRSLSEFVVSAASDVAIRTIERTELVFLSYQEQQRFAAELIDPSPLSPAMERAVLRHRDLIGSTE